MLFNNIIFSTIPTLGQTVEPVRLGIEHSSSGIPTTSPSPSFRSSWSYFRDDGHKTRKPEIYRSWFNNTSRRYRRTLAFHATSAEVALLLILFAVGGAFVTLSANVIIYFTPPDSTAVVAATYSTMRIIGGAIGPVIAGLFLGLYTSEVTTFRRRGLVCAQCVCV